ncbi:MAG: class I SAM-dependent methyltransferase [archaeon]|nr:class I SAM-dependent methyltransferase [archaeon]
MLFFWKKKPKEIEAPDWEEVYKHTETKDLPWFSETLDKDFEKEIKERKLKGDVLDIGTGSGIHAIAMTRLGLNVTGIDISRNAIEKAKKLGEKEKVKVNFLFDDILHSILLSETFDFAFDKSCFHWIMPEQRPHYADIVCGLLKKNGLLFLKVNSSRIESTNESYSFSQKQIEEIFSKKFEILEIRDDIISRKGKVKMLVVLKKK